MLSEGSTKTRHNVAKNHAYDYTVRIQNDGQATDKFKVQATPTGNATITVKYFVGAVDRTAAITAGTYLTGNAAAGTFKTVRIEVTVSSSAGGNATNTVVLTATSNSEPSQVDVVRAITSR